MKIKFISIREKIHNLTAPKPADHVGILKRTGEAVQHAASVALDTSIADIGRGSKRFVRRQKEKLAERILIKLLTEGVESAKSTADSKTTSNVILPGVSDEIAAKIFQEKAVTATTAEVANA